eukprot:354182-Chlamydomonas_euryale.AAC.6
MSLHAAAAAAAAALAFAGVAVPFIPGLMRAIKAAGKTPHMQRSLAGVVESRGHCSPSTPAFTHGLTVRRSEG